ncbi:MAG: protein-L-isoaspartate O-methyltransferase [Rhodothalassiaceae bacterium]
MMMHLSENNEDSRVQRAAMIAGQILPNRVADDRTLAAIRSVPREVFVPKAWKGVAYVDEDIEIAPGRWLLEPMVFARLLHAANVKESDAVLDIGCGTGYSAAVLSRLANCVIAIEENPDLAAKANELLSALDIHSVAVKEAPLAGGLPDHGPYDVIFMNGAVETIPDALIEQLAEGGRLLAVYRHDGLSRGHIVRKIAGTIARRDLFDAFTPILPGFERPKSFQF